MLFVIYNFKIKFVYRWLIATQFQPTHARSVFPCYDEPAYRATFNISIKIKRKKNEIALSNMPVSNTYDV